MSVEIVASVLPADYSRLGEECQELEAGGIDRIQWDAMDGVFVPNLTFGPDVIAACRRVCDVPFEAHLMTQRPEELLPRYVEAGCELVIVHPETLLQPHRTYQEIRELGAKVGIALSPATPVAHIEHVLDVTDLVLVMTVSPGFGGQSYLSSMEPKIARVREMIDTSGYQVALEVDGGVGPDTIVGAAAAGADTFAVGSALWKYPTRHEAVADLRERAERGRG